MRKKDTADVARVIPAYNEGKIIRQTIASIPARYQNIICIDDGSKDDTRYQALSTRARVVTHPINLGQGAALQTGIDYALTDKSVRYIVTFDADGQHQIEDVDAMLAHIKKRTDLQILLGSRFLGKTENITASKRLLLKAAIAFSNRSSGVILTDTHNGLRVIRRDAAEGMKLKMADYAHASEIIERIAQRNFTYEEYPVTIVYTDYSRSKGQSLLNAVNIAFNMLLGRLDKK